MSRRPAPLFLLAALGWLATALTVWLGPGPLLRAAEQSAYDAHLRSLPRCAPDPRIVVVGLDEATLTALPDLDRPFYPLPRRYHARVVDRLRRAGARVVAFDLMFGRATEDDTGFGAALQRHGRTVVAATPSVRLEGGREVATFADPPPPIAAASRAASILLPGDGGKVRRYLALRSDDLRVGERRPHFGLAVAAEFFDEADASPVLRDALTWGTRIAAPVEADPGGDVLIRFVGPAGTFPVLSYARAATGAFDPATVRDRIVLIGPSLPLEDQHETPLGKMSGTEILANLVQQALNGDWIRSGSVWISLSAGAGLCATFALCLARGGMAWAFGGAAVLSAAWFAAARWAFVRWGVWLWLFPPYAALGATALLTIPWELARTRRTLERFVPSWVARRVYAGEGLSSRTAERPVSVVFCDIRGFTAYCESHTAEEAETLLQRYFDAGERAAKRFGTELDKYVGDQIMLTFFPLARREHHALRAVRWSLAMQREVDALGIRVGIGIATGRAREGFIGTRGRLQSTVIGDVVNTAARLESATKDVGHPVLIDDGTFSQLGDAVACEPLGSLVVRGKQAGVVAYAPSAEV